MNDTVEPNNFNAEIRSRYDKLANDQVKKTSEEKYLYLCFCPNNQDNYLKDNYESQYGFIFSLSAHIQKLKNSRSKINVKRADLLKVLVSDLFNTDLSEVNTTIKDFQQKHSKELGKGLIFPSKTWSFLDKMADNTSNIQEGSSFAKIVNYKAFDNNTSNKESYIDPIINKCVANAMVKKFQRLIDNRIMEATQDALDKRRFFTKVYHFFIPSVKKTYVNNKLALLNAKLQEYRELSSAQRVLKKVRSEEKSDKDFTSIFGGTPIGNKLSNTWKGFKSAFKMVTDCLKRKENQQKVEQEKREEEEKKLPEQQKRFKAEKEKKLLEQKKREELKKKTTNNRQFFKSTSHPKKQSKSGFYPNKIKKICFDRQQQFGTVEINYKRNIYYMSRYIDRIKYKEYKNSKNEFLRNIAKCYKVTNSKAFMGVGIEFEKKEFDKIFSNGSSNKNNVKSF